MVTKVSNTEKVIGVLNSNGSKRIIKGKGQNGWLKELLIKLFSFFISI
jgi:hypothetical protein